MSQTHLHVPCCSDSFHLKLRRYTLAGHARFRKHQQAAAPQGRIFKRPQAQRPGAEYKVVSNWNGTIELPTYEFGDKILQEGSFGGDVLELQRFLHEQGYFPRLRETPDGYTGYFGDLTKEALQAWQEDYHLTADGRFGQSCRQAVTIQQEGVQMEHNKRQHAVQQAVQQAAPVPERSVSPIQIAGFAFLLGGVAMFAYQVWAWWRNSQQTTGSLSHDLQDERQEQMGKWRGTIADDRTRSSLPSYASYSAAKGSPVTSSNPLPPSSYVRPPSPLPLVRPRSRGATPPQTPSSALDPVSLDGYPRYAPQWGVGLPEKKKVVPPTPVRKEPSERAKAVMTRPGTPAYPKPGVGGSKAVAGSARAEPSDRARRDATDPAKRPRSPYASRPRSPNPTAMPESLTTTPPLKPSLDPSAKSWIEIAVSQRGPNETRRGQQTEGRSRNGSQQPKQAIPGSHGSGVAQVLSVEQERQSAFSRNSHLGSNGSGSRNSNENGDGINGIYSNITGVNNKKSGGVSLFGSYKAPVRPQ